MLVARATGSYADDDRYTELRRELLDDPFLSGRMPRFIQSCRSLAQFWGQIKKVADTYQQRRDFIWDAFRPAHEFIEGKAAAAGDEYVADALRELDSEAVNTLWRRALERRSSDPEGAITAARSLLESVCKHILDEIGVTYTTRDGLPKLYGRVAENLDLSPGQYSEEVFKQILGGCKATVDGLAGVRNRLSDAHGKGKQPVKPAPRHAALAVNLAGTMSSFLVETYLERTSHP